MREMDWKCDKHDLHIICISNQLVDWSNVHTAQREHELILSMMFVSDFIDFAEIKLKFFFLLF